MLTVLTARLVHPEVESPDRDPGIITLLSALVRGARRVGRMQRDAVAGEVEQHGVAGLDPVGEAAEAAQEGFLADVRREQGDPVAQRLGGGGDRSGIGRGALELGARPELGVGIGDT